MHEKRKRISALAEIYGVRRFFIASFAISSRDSFAFSIDLFAKYLFQWNESLVCEEADKRWKQSNCGIFFFTSNSWEWFRVKKSWGSLGHMRSFEPFSNFPNLSFKPYRNCSISWQERRQIKERDKNRLAFCLLLCNSISSDSWPIKFQIHVSHSHSFCHV